MNLCPYFTYREGNVYQIPFQGMGLKFCFEGTIIDELHAKDSRTKDIGEPERNNKKAVNVNANISRVRIYG